MSEPEHNPAVDLNNARNLRIEKTVRHGDKSVTVVHQLDTTPTSNLESAIGLLLASASLRREQHEIALMDYKEFFDWTEKQKSVMQAISVHPLIKFA